MAIFGVFVETMIRTSVGKATETIVKYASKCLKVALYMRRFLVAAWMVGVACAWGIPNRSEAM